VSGKFEDIIKELLEDSKSNEEFGLESKELEDKERALDVFEKPRKVGG
jgi:hypothetical protein